MKIVKKALDNLARTIIDITSTLAGTYGAVRLRDSIDEIKDRLEGYSINLPPELKIPLKQTLYNLDKSLNDKVPFNELLNLFDTIKYVNPEHINELYIRALQDSKFYICSDIESLAYLVTGAVVGYLTGKLLYKKLKNSFRL